MGEHRSGFGLKRPGAGRWPAPSAGPPLGAVSHRHLAVGVAGQRVEINDDTCRWMEFENDAPTQKLFLDPTTGQMTHKEN